VDREASLSVKKDWSLRLARETDVPALEELIPLSVRVLQAPYYSTAQMDSALGSVFGVDRQLIRDRTYFVVERNNELIGCGGWSKRKTLFGGDQYADRETGYLDPATGAAKIRAFFVHPDFARRGLGESILERCEQEARAQGFTRFELMSTLPGIRFYAAHGYVAGERTQWPLGPGLTIDFLPMAKRAPTSR